jgi:hypothetical protein
VDPCVEGDEKKLFERLSRLSLFTGILDTKMNELGKEGFNKLKDHDAWFYHVTWCSLKNIVKYNHTNWYETSEIYKKYYNNLGQRKQDYVRNVLDGHYCLLPEFILMLTRGDNNIDWRNKGYVSMCFYHSD